MLKAWSSLFLLGLCGPAFGQTIYQCTSPNGDINYSAQRCSDDETTAVLSATTDPARIRAEGEKSRRSGVRPLQRECHAALERVNDIDRRLHDIHQEIRELGPAFYRASKNAKGSDSRAGVLRRIREKESLLLAVEESRPQAASSARVVCDLGQLMHERETDAVSPTG